MGRGGGRLMPSRPGLGPTGELPESGSLHGTYHGASAALIAPSLSWFRRIIGYMESSIASIRGAMRLIVVHYPDPSTLHNMHSMESVPT